MSTQNPVSESYLHHFLSFPSEGMLLIKSMENFTKPKAKNATGQSQQLEL